MFYNYDLSCQTSIDCDFFVLDQKSTTCYLKSMSDGGPKVAATGITSGPKFCDGNMVVS
jgi:hypothetical protein